MANKPSCSTFWTAATVTCKPTIILTNQDVKGLQEYIEERTFDRLREVSRLVTFDWESYRPVARKSPSMTRAQANQLLDFVRAGGAVPESQILFALWVTGDLLARRNDMRHLQTLEPKEAGEMAKHKFAPCALK